MNHIGSPCHAAEQFRLMLDDTDQFMRRVLVPHNNNIQFQIDGILFQANYTFDNDIIELHIWATLGYLPYSVESAERRRALITILEGLRYERNAQFGINKNYQIVVLLTTKVKSIHLPEFIFLPLLTFLEKNLPYIRLIGEYL